MYDVLIQNGTLIDGSGRSRFRGDVAIQGDRIVKIAEKIDEPTKRVINAEGLFVSPGFIDYHSHSDNDVLLDPDSYNFLEQGTTTQITGQCGSGPAPFYEDLEFHGQHGLDKATNTFIQ